MHALNLVELTADEARNIDGGVLPLLVWAGIAFGAGLTAGVAAGAAALAAK